MCAKFKDPEVAREKLLAVAFEKTDVSHPYKLQVRINLQVSICWKSRGRWQSQGHRQPMGRAHGSCVKDVSLHLDGSPGGALELWRTHQAV